MTQKPSKAQVPMIYQGAFTGTWWCATKWRDLGEGRFEALEKFDVSTQIDEILACGTRGHWDAEDDATLQSPPETLIP